MVPVETVANLFTGSNRIRFAAFTLSTLPAFPPESGHHELESVSVAGAVLRDSFASSHRWYEEFAEMLADRAASRWIHRRPTTRSCTTCSRRRSTRRGARRGGERLRKMLQMLWAEELLEAQRQVQADLAAEADRFVRHSGHRLLI